MKLAKGIFYFITLPVLLFLVGFSDGNARTQEKTKFYSIRVGYYGEGTATVKTDNNEQDYDTESGVAFGFAYDKVGEGIWVYGIAIDIIQVKFPGESSLAFHGNGTLKMNFDSDKIAVRPAIGAGVGFGQSIGNIDASIHFTARILNDFVYKFDPKVGFLAEAGLLWDIWGNAGEYDVSGGPFPFIRSGFVF